jgi:hypothetical protein
MSAHKIEIASGEGERGTVEAHVGPPTTRAIRSRLTAERSGGDRWAHVLIDGERVADADLEYALRSLRSRSGTPWTEAQYAARGRGRMTLRMSLEAHELLAAQAEDAGCSASELVEELIRGAQRAR